MAYDPGAIEAALAAAVGDEPALIAELRGAFLDSAQQALAAMQAARVAADWTAAAWRLRGLAASFGAVRLMALATEAETASVGDAVLLRRIERVIAAI